MRIGRHHHHPVEDHTDDQGDQRDTPVWQASKPVWGEVRIAAPKARDLAA